MRTLFILISTILISSISYGATITVTNVNDSGAGSLRDALSNASSGDDIIFNAGLAGSTINLNSTLSINTDLTISGFSSGPTVFINGGGNTRLFSILNGNNVTIDWMDLSGGSASTGGAILNSGNLSISYCRLHDNQSLVNGSATQGGAALFNNTTGTATVDHCEFQNNTVNKNPFVTPGNNVYYGGAIYNRGIQLNLNYCTFHLNSVGFSSVYGASKGGAVYNLTQIAINSSTFSNNTCYTTSVYAAYGGNIYNDVGGFVDIKNSTIRKGGVSSTSLSSTLKGGNIWNSGTIQLENTIVASGLASTLIEGTDIYTVSGTGSAVSLGYNVIQTLDNSQVTLVTGDMSVNPMMGNIAYNNGAFTQTSAPSCNSPVINTGNNTNAPAFDQAGQTRIFDGTIDIGAFEAHSGITPSPTVTGFSNLSHHGTTISWSVPNSLAIQDLVVRYHVFGDSPNFSWKNVPNANATSAYINGLDASTRYVFRVGSRCIVGNAVYSDTMSVVTKAFCPPATGLMGSRTSTTTATISWDDMGVNQYKIRYRNVGGAQWRYKTVSGSFTSADLVNLLPTEVYEWKIRTLCEGGNQPYGQLQNLPLAAGRLAAASVDGLIAYPNPAKENITVSFTMTNDDQVTIAILDMAGRQMRVVDKAVNRGNNTVDMPLNDLTNGVYLINIKATQGVDQHIRLIKE